jgi:aryl-alcohol dehydrogenase-like predicted oxidoreductase
MVSVSRCVACLVPAAAAEGVTAASESHGQFAVAWCGHAAILARRGVILLLAPARSVDLMTRMTTRELAHAVRAALANCKPAGAAGVAIPPVALGCGNFGGVGSAPEFFGGGLSDDQARELMDAAWELGITHFDTADAYGGGRSERSIGRWIASRGVVPRLTTKTFNPMTAGADRGLRPERIVRQLESSLERLGVAQVDLYLAHDFDPDVPLADTMAAFEDAIAAGLIRAYGVSNFNSGQLLSALTAGTPAAIQNSFSLLARQDALDLLDMCQHHNVAYLAFSPLAGGWLTGKYRRGEPYPAGSRMTQRPEPYADLERSQIFDLLDRLAGIAHDRGSSMAGLALAWLLSDDRVTQVVVGPGSRMQLAPVAEALAHPLTTDERAAVDRALALLDD